MESSRTGYTGEDSVEIVVGAELAGIVWDALRDRGVAPCGLGSRDALCMEMGGLRLSAATDVAVQDLKPCDGLAGQVSEHSR